MRRWWLVAGLVVAGSVALEVAFRHLAHAEYFWQVIPGFDFAYGFLGCWLIVVASKWLGKSFIQRDEGYYRDDAP